MGRLCWITLCIHTETDGNTQKPPISGQKVCVGDEEQGPWGNTRSIFFGSGTPRPKTIAARESLSQIDFFTGTPRPGTPRPGCKNTLFVEYNGKQQIQWKATWNTMENNKYNGKQMYI